jgi:hypothetical protein
MIKINRLAVPEAFISGTFRPGMFRLGTIGIGLFMLTGIVHAEGNPWALQNRQAPTSQNTYWQGSNRSVPQQPATQPAYQQPRQVTSYGQRQPYGNYLAPRTGFTPYNRYNAFNRATPYNRPYTRLTPTNRFTPYTPATRYNRFSPYAMNRYNAYRRPGMLRRPPPKHKHHSKLWGESPPSEWMTMPPDRDKWIQAWDDMIDAPYRQGEYPGGFYAPEVILPNPVDMAGQFKDNAVDLPEQLKEGEIGNVVSDTNEDE